MSFSLKISFYFLFLNQRNCANRCNAEFLIYVHLFVFCMFILKVLFSGRLIVYLSVALTFLICQLPRSDGQFTHGTINLQNTQDTWHLVKFSRLDVYSYKSNIKKNFHDHLNVDQNDNILEHMKTLLSYRMWKLRSLYRIKGGILLKIKLFWYLKRR